MEPIRIGRRQLMRASATFLASFGFGGIAFSAEREKQEAEDISPPEDLMREHGVLRRILLLYEDLHKKLNDRADVQWSMVDACAAVIRSFVEDYHEKLEEQYVFPAVRKTGKLTALVDVLLRQHQAGRKLTDTVIQIAHRQGAENGDHALLNTVIEQFVAMYRPHAAREDTVLFPLLHIVWPGKEFRKMGEVFKKEEDRLFGQGGFVRMVGRVAAIEKEAGIYELARFTPEV